MRPLLHIPRGPRRLRHRGASSSSLLLACPRVSPEWELAAVQALVKPQLGGAIAHRSGRQQLPSDARGRVDRVARVFSDRLGFAPPLHFPPAGEYFFLASLDRSDDLAARAFAMALSLQLPDTWLVLGRLFVHNGTFYRRRYGYKLKLVPATNIHLTRPLRAALKDVLHPNRQKK